jgi:hypothetical protein
MPWAHSTTLVENCNKYKPLHHYGSSCSH